MYPLVCKPSPADAAIYVIFVFLVFATKHEFVTLGWWHKYGTEEAGQGDRKDDCLSYNDGPVHTVEYSHW